jgi:hypothetical protein
MSLTPQQIEALLRVICDSAFIDGIDVYATPEDMVETVILKYSHIPLDGENLLNLKREFESRFYISQVEGSSIIDDYEHLGDWYTKLRESGNHGDDFFWKRYKDYLIRDEGLNVNVVNVLDYSILPTLMNYVGDPSSKEEFSRRGLIIGDVQSGKTSTYTGLICKAADAGYKIVILLTGVTESLRSQTQERIEKGIIGQTITGLKNEKTPNSAKRQWVGVGCYDKKLVATAMTSVEYDFVGHIDKQLTISLATNKLVLFIVKKNVSVLNKLYSWLYESNVYSSSRKIDFPMLMIDDEADNASINTHREEDDPTRTNEIIRKLLKIFRQNSYVGVTATPFANVFINPDSKEEMLGDDLFPRNFIYALKPPTNYIGASSIYMDNSKYSEALVYIHDVDEPDDPIDRSVYTDDGGFFYKHTKEWRGVLPDSLKDAIYCYFLTNAVRVLRGDGGEPMTMMINMSRFVKVQKYIQEYVSNFYDCIYNTIRIDFSDNSVENSDLPLYKQLHKCWINHFKNVVDIEWTQVSRKINLLQGVEDVQVIVVNSSKTSGKLDYAKNKSLRAIAIGGLALSRGLTLKGLVVSYFYRNTATYDVLMQMGRWFGYRKNYDDLFRIWTSRQSAELYRDISEATEELKDEIEKMRAAELTPNDFGLRVRDDSDDLGITARNKMRHTSNHIEQLSYRGCVFDTPYLSSDSNLCKNNTKVTKNFINKLIIAGHGFEKQDRDNRKLYISRDVPSYNIKLFLEQVTVHKSNIHFDTEQIAKFIEESNTELPRYDVVLIEGDGDKHEINQQIKIKPVVRGFDITGERININKRRGRLTSPADAKQGLTDSQSDSAKEQAREDGWNGIQTLPRETWFKYVKDRNPLLMIYFIKLKSDENSSQKDQKYIDDMGEELNVGFAIGFPAGANGTDADRRLYRVNMVYERQSNQEDESIEE